MQRVGRFLASRPTLVVPSAQMLMRLKCVGLHCTKKDTCERFLSPVATTYTQDLMTPPDGECDKYWEHRPCKNPAPTSDHPREVRIKLSWML